MVRISGLGGRVYVGDSNISGDVASLSNVSSPVAAADLTGIDAFAYERAQGLSGGSMDLSCHFNSARAHAELKGLPRTDVLVSYFTKASLGADAACLLAKQIGYDPSRNADGSLTMAVQALSNARPLKWGKALTAGTRTDTEATDGSAVFLGPEGPSVAVTSSSIADPTVITTGANHGLTSGDSVTIAGHADSTPDINGDWTVTVTGLNTFTIPVEVTTGGTGGTVRRTSTRAGLVAFAHVLSKTGTPSLKIQGSSDGGVNDSWADITGADFGAVAAGFYVVETASNALVEGHLRLVSTGTFTELSAAVVVARRRL